MKRYLVRSSTTTIRYGLWLAAPLWAAVAGCDKLGLTAAPGIRLQPDSAVLAMHQRVQLSVSVHDVQAADVYFISSDTSVAVVDRQGWAQAVGYGRAVVTAVDMQRSALTDSAVLRVPAPAGAWLVLLPDTTSVGVGAGRRLGWRVGGTSDAHVRFSSSDSTIAEVSDSGYVCGRALGQAAIRAAAVSDVAALDSTRIRVLPATMPPGVVTGVAATTSPPTVSIVSIVDSAGKPVDLSAVRGTIRVILNLDTPPCFVHYAPVLLIDGRPWQVGPEVRVGELRSYTFSVDTRATDTAGQPLLANGQHVLSVIIRQSGGSTLASASLAITLAN